MMWSYSVLLLIGIGTVRCDDICCGDAGCFSNNWPFKLMPLPKCPDELSISLNVFTRSNLSNGQLVTSTSIPSVFDGAKLTMFLVHGWYNWLGNEGYMRMFYDLKDAVLLQARLTKHPLHDKIAGPMLRCELLADYNVIVVTWDSKNLIYPQSASDTRSVGAEIGLVAANLIAQGNSTKSRLYCVGHSLGAHVCGHAGMRTKFGRITGLDPAGPFFNDRDVTAGLNPTSADLVDVIHTDGGAGLGFMMIRGNVDFYPNGGRHQPGCSFTDIGCSHLRALEFFTESVKTPCFDSYQNCTDQNKLPGSCTVNSVAVQSMGFPASNYTARGIFYLTTSSRSSFACSSVLSTLVMALLCIVVS